MTKACHQRRGAEQQQDNRHRPFSDEPAMHVVRQFGNAARAQAPRLGLGLCLH